MRVLGIETSCDETGVAIYDSNQGLLSHILHTQVALHAAYGGVVPELASRDHVQKTLPLIHSALQQAGISLAELDGIAYTAGPGLVGALLVGAMLGRSLAFACNIPAIAVHHMEGHLLAPMLEPDPPAFPFIVLLVSGGHTQLIDAVQPGDYRVLGDTLDDAVGEAFDKTAKLLGLGYPGGAALSQLAAQGNPARFQFPRPMLNRPGLDFSFSGLKTFAANTLRQTPPDATLLADIARAFQDAVVDTLVAKCRRALLQSHRKTLVVAGGVSANLPLRAGLNHMTKKLDARVYFPRIEFCTDNGAMIAYAGCQRLLAGEENDLSVNVFPRWPLSQLKKCNHSAYFR